MTNVLDCIDEEEKKLFTFFSRCFHRLAGGELTTELIV